MVLWFNQRPQSLFMSIEISDMYIYVAVPTSTSMPGKSLLRNALATNYRLTVSQQCSQPSRHSPEQINDRQLAWTRVQTTHAHMIASSKRAASYIRARTLWIVHSHYRRTVKSKYVDIDISFAQPSQASLSYTSKQDDIDKMERVWLA